MTDEEIIALFLERSELAISELAEEHGAAVRRVAMNILEDPADAEECVNDTWLGAWNSIPPQHPSPLRTYVCKIARNLAVKRFHANQAQKRNSRYDLALDELAECVPDRFCVEDIAAAKELSESINAFLDTLPYEDKFLFMRRYWYADSIKDIAGAMHSRENRISVRLFRLREKLRTHLKKEGFLV